MLLCVDHFCLVADVCFKRWSTEMWPGKPFSKSLCTNSGVKHHGPSACPPQKNESFNPPPQQKLLETLKQTKLHPRVRCFSQRFLLKSHLKILEPQCFVPAPSKGCLLEAFIYLKTTNKHPLEGAGRSFFKINTLILSAFPRINCAVHSTTCSCRKTSGWPTRTLAASGCVFLNVLLGSKVPSTPPPKKNAYSGNLWSPLFFLFTQSRIFTLERIDFKWFQLFLKRCLDFSVECQ